MESSSGDIPKHLRKGNDVPNVLTLATDITVAYIANPAHSGGADQLLTIIREVANTLQSLADGEVSSLSQYPFSSADVDGTQDTLMCVVCGKRVTMLKRHLMTDHTLTPEEYRRQYNLSADTPMVTQEYAEVRSKLAKDSGLGKRRVKVIETPTKRPYKKRKIQLIRGGGW